MRDLACTDPRRREILQRNQRLNGLDYLDISADQRVLRVYLIDKTPVSVTPEQIRIEGGRKVRNIQVTRVSLNRSERLEIDDYLEVTVDRPGDFSTYTLKVIAGDGEQPDIPHPAFDPYYSTLDFSFKVGCPGDLDCATARHCPEPARQEPDLNYLARDYASFRQLLLDRLALVMPDWKERHVPDMGVALVEILAYVGDHLSYYQDAVATEAYLETARLRTSVRRHARLVDYPMHEGCNARAWVCVETESNVQLKPDSLFFTTRLDSGKGSFGPLLSRHDLETGNVQFLQFEPVSHAQIRLYADHNEIAFYTWGQQECCLDKGATEATLYGELVDACDDDK
ncbi:MAG: putative baseplate assembly protein, partial [Xanthomonadales bacterium]|nr:putative baseplate assembly protein [Xanthomonadales bacterium]